MGVRCRTLVWMQLSFSNWIRSLRGSQGRVLTGQKTVFEHSPLSSHVEVLRCHQVAPKHFNMTGQNSPHIVRHSLGESVMPLSGDGVLLEQGGDPILTFGFALTGGLPLGLLQDELLVGGLRLVLVVDGPGHVLPQPDPEAHGSDGGSSGGREMSASAANLSDSNSLCSSIGTVHRISRLCLSSDVGFQNVSMVPVFLSLMKISLSCEGRQQLF